jgi:hypothetical protein
MERRDYTTVSEELGQLKIKSNQISRSSVKALTLHGVRDVIVCGDFG